MPPQPFQLSAALVDLSARVAASTAVVGSPALAAETIIGSVTLPGGLTYASGCIVSGWAAFTVGTSGTAVTLRLRQTSVAGTVVATSGALTGGVAAAALLAQDVDGFDAAPGDSQIYKLTLQVTAGAAVSTVSAVLLYAIAV
jgi:hypothetical protein